MERTTFKQKITNVLKRYGYYFLFGLILVAILTTIIVIGVNNSKKSNAPVTTPTSSTVTPFMPVLNATIYKEYCGDKLTYNSTLKQWETHNAIDFQVANGSSVYSILDGTVDMIATDHAPHSAEEKGKGLAGSAFGIVGLETAFQLMYTSFVKTGEITIEKLIELMAINPRKRFNIPLNTDYTVWDLNKEYTIKSEDFLSKGKAMPFEGVKVNGKCVLTVCNGNVVYSE